MLRTGVRKGQTEIVHLRGLDTSDRTLPRTNLRVDALLVGKFSYETIQGEHKTVDDYMLRPAPLSFDEFLAALRGDFRLVRWQQRKNRRTREMEWVAVPDY